MNEDSQRNIDAFFRAIEPWRTAYRVARLHVVGVRSAEVLKVLSARIYLDAGRDTECKPSFHGGEIEAHQLLLDQEKVSVQAVARAIASVAGFYADGIGRLTLPTIGDDQAVVPAPTVLHAEGISEGNRLGVLSFIGREVAALIPQPASDWLLKSADSPYDSMQELTVDYGLGTLRGDRALLEVVARTAIEVLAESAVSGTKAMLGVLIASSLDPAQAKLGFRVLHQGRVVKRGAIRGSDLKWSDRGHVTAGTGEIDVPAGAVIQCFASYADAAHHVQWRADPAIFVNPRAAILSQVDPSNSLVQGYLRPDLPAKGRAADDFETAIAWLLWGLGFSVASFGMNAKSRDTFDVVATTPRGDFVLVECTLGLLRAEHKLSRLAARTAKVRETLAAANMKHLRVLPVIVTAMTREQVEADSGVAADLGVLVVTREDFDGVQNELVRFPDADALFDRGFNAVHEIQAARKNQFVAIKQASQAAETRTP